MKRQGTGLEKILATIYFDKDLTARIYFKKSYMLMLER